MNHLICGNALRIPLADKAVQCAITSPPYWGLRDYGTAEWIGGDPECEHKVGNQVTDNKAPGAILSGVRPGVDMSHCKKCGARRKDNQLGLEPTYQQYVANMVLVFREVRRVLADDGVLWLNIGDSYASSGGAHDGRQDNQLGVGAKAVHLNGAGDKGHRSPPEDLPPKNLVGIPWRLAFALQDDGWILRSDIIWHKPNPMPESVTDRPTKAHEYVFLLSKQGRYFYDAEAIKTPRTSNKQRPNFRGGAYVNNGTFDNGNGGKSIDIGNVAADDTTRNRRTVWTVATQPYSGAHFATFPPALVEPMILAGSRPGDIVMDPFSGTGTVGMVAIKHNRSYVGIELNPQYIDLAKQRTNNIQLSLL